MIEYSMGAGPATLSESSHHHSTKVHYLWARPSTGTTGTTTRWVEKGAEHHHPHPAIYLFECPPPQQHAVLPLPSLLLLPTPGWPVTHWSIVRAGPRCPRPHTTSTLLEDNHTMRSLLLSIPFFLFSSSRAFMLILFCFLTKLQDYCSADCVQSSCGLASVYFSRNTPFLCFLRFF